MEDDAQLIRRAMLGHAPALEALIGLHYDAIHAFCCRRVGNAEQGADLCQDTFLKMVDSLPRYREQGRFRSWLFTIAANLCRDAFRRGRPMAELDETLPDARAHRFTADTENGELLRGALARLPDAQQETVVLRYYHDFSIDEIAHITRVPGATVKTRLHRALKRLREFLGEDVLLEG